MNIKQMRNAVKMTQSDVAHEMGCSQVSVFQWESGRSFPELPKIPKLAKLYNVTEGEIIAAITAAKEAG